MTGFWYWTIQKQVLGRRENKVSFDNPKPETRNSKLPHESWH